MKLTLVVLIPLIFVLSCSSRLLRTESYKDTSIRVGETQDAILERWGKPDDINRTIVTDGEGEQWVYNCKYFTPCSSFCDCERYYYGPCVYLYFENGKLTSWPDTR